MKFPERFSNLPAHVWPRLRALLDAHDGGGTPIHMTIGEPKHAFPAWSQKQLRKMQPVLTAILQTTAHPNCGVPSPVGSNDATALKWTPIPK